MLVEPKETSMPSSSSSATTRDDTFFSKFSNYNSDYDENDDGDDDYNNQDQIIDNHQSNELNELNELIECSFHKWCHDFEKISLTSKYIRIPKNVLNYLHDEIIILPKECYENSTIGCYNDETIMSINYQENNKEIENRKYNDDDDDDDDDYDNDDEQDLVIPEFHEFSNQLKYLIKSLNGSVFIKTNWHCPKDAFWITVGQTLKVKDITDIYQLLKASSIVKNDLSINSTNNVHYNENIASCSSSSNSTNNNDGGDAIIEHYLILKKWVEIDSGTEYRCFVKNRSLIAISPRDWPQYHEHILHQKHDIVMDILSMYKEQIKHRFTLDNFVFDVVRAAKDQVYLLDFSPFNSKYTESLAFTWNELNTMFNGNEDDPEFRYLPNDCGIQPNKRNNYGIPQDIINLFSGSGRREAETSHDPFTINVAEILTQRIREV